MSDKEKEPKKEPGGEYGDTQSTINANIELVKMTENPKQEEKPVSLRTVWYSGQGFGTLK